MTITDFLIMNQNTDAIVEAIESLRPTTDYAKDYLFPVALAFGSAFFGGLSAVYINKIQGLQRIARDNLVTSIQAVALAQDCISHLVSIKANYIDIDSDEPLARAMAFATIVTKFEDVTFSTNGLYFIRSIPTANKTCFESIAWKIKHRILKMKVKTPSPEELRKTWRNSVRVGAMFGNYNEAMGLLRFRNELSEQVKEKIPLDSNGLTLEKFQIILGHKLCGGYVDITESSIALIDNLIVEFHHFLLEFPAIAASNIELSRIREWGGIPTYENKQESYLKCLEPIIKPDFSKFSTYTGMSEQDAKKRYMFKSWYD
ncbi:nuclear transport factor 2 family protein [Yersinia massiliensis]|uniref:Uncharacterized protein n=1 Tax=Yersinia thracica TaxID=2890319 RepID=A0A0T9QDR4_9GAMM|nr:MULTISPECIES: hypothetical protein [Yersinia]MBX9474157.1 hypothetical protein [Yersinia enterocolitica]MDA5548582.1 hypothetical protein [Yersinia massiliensis]UYK06116.1 nuclear transport factor 2 family protein [Yersinia enterocolitica]UZM79521.1 nuclear transport factor 2 family protein [Yersinia massiliensis]CNI06580.1 Uncharacterised protein [Yersinia thracica]